MRRASGVLLLVACSSSPRPPAAAGSAAVPPAPDASVADAAPPDAPPDAPVDAALPPDAAPKPALPPGPEPDFDGPRTLNWDPGTGKPVVIDVALCTPDRGRIDVAMGSTTIAVIGKQAGKCVLEYGGEVENPRWDGELSVHCEIPVKLRKVTLKTRQTGLNTAPIDAYCKAR